jgi:hypothetical protein
VKSLAAVLGSVLCLSACAQHSTTTAATGATTAATRATASASPAAVRRADVVTPAAAPPRTIPPPVARLRPVRRPAPPVVPQILGASVSPTVVGSGSVVSAVVRTTPGVVSVVAYAGGASIAVPRVAAGRFAGSTTLPPLPSFAHGSYAVTFVARDAHGSTTQSAVGVTVR